MYELISDYGTVESAPRPAPLARQKFSTAHLPANQQFEAWRELTAPLVEIKRGPWQVDGYRAEQTLWDLGSMAFVRSRVEDMSFGRTSRQLRADTIDHWFFTCADRGQVRTAGRGRVAVSSSQTVVVQSLRGEFEGAATSLSVLNVFVPRDVCREAAAALDSADNTRLASGLGRLLSSYLLDVERRLPSFSEDELPGLTAATRAMILACVAPSPDRLEEAQTPIQATLLERARQLVQQNLFSPRLSIDDLCRELGVSRSRLYRLFEPLGGVVHYIRYRRLLDAHRALSDANDSRPIVDIAAERGFVDAAEFSRAFKREFGYRPTDARNHTALRPAARAAVGSKDGRTALGDLLRRLN